MNRARGTPMRFCNPPGRTRLQPVKVDPNTMTAAHRPRSKFVGDFHNAIASHGRVAGVCTSCPACCAQHEADLFGANFAAHGFFVDGPQRKLMPGEQF